MEPRTKTCGPGSEALQPLPCKGRAEGVEEPRKPGAGEGAEGWRGWRWWANDVDCLGNISYWFGALGGVAPKFARTELAGLLVGGFVSSFFGPELFSQPA